MAGSSAESANAPRSGDILKPAVFLDRDGVLIELAYDREDRSYESPLSLEEIRLAQGAAEGVGDIKKAGWQIVVVSNQPVVAKAKVTEAEFMEMQDRVALLLAEEGSAIDEWRYCFHHPEARVEALRGPCSCRKPEPGMIIEAAGDLGLDLKRSWVIGDSDTDVQAGHAAGCRTILVENPRSAHRRGGESYPDRRAGSLREAALLLPNPEVRDDRGRSTND